MIRRKIDGHLQSAAVSQKRARADGDSLFRRFTTLLIRLCLNRHAGRGWMAGLRALAGHVRTSPPPPQRNRPALRVPNPSVFLRDQLHEDSNCELDWLWAASQVATAEEIRYCLERALYINPDNRETQRALSKLLARHAADEKQAVNRPGFAQASDH